MTTTEVALPDLGSGVSSGELIAWVIDPGDRVAADQTIAEVETDKSVVEIPAPAPGVVTELRVEPGAQVAEGDVVAVVEVDEGAEAESTEAEPAVASEPEERTPTSQGDEPDVAAGRVFAPPRVRRLARDLSVDITTVDGTGDGGAITESDVRAAAEKTSTSETGEQTGPRSFSGGTAATVPRETSTEAVEGPEALDRDDSPRQPSATKSVVRRREGDADPLAERVESDHEPESSAPAKAAAQADAAVAEPSSAVPAGPSAVPAGSSTVGTQTTHHDDVDVTALQAARERLAAAGVADGEITDLAFAVGAVAAALKSVPALNGPIEGGEIDRRETANVAIAIPTDEGLVEPVVVDADDVRLPVLAREVSELVDRAGNGSLSPPETADGTFTVTDFGALGGTYATPSVAATGTAVLALGEIRQRPRIRDGEVTARAILPLSAAVDARAVDGAAAAQFLTEVRRYLNTPELLLLE